VNPPAPGSIAERCERGITRTVTEAIAPCSIPRTGVDGNE
jgi:hypothetical protein